MQSPIEFTTISNAGLVPKLKKSLNALFQNLLALDCDASSLDYGAGETHTRTQISSRCVLSKFPASARFYFTRPTIAIVKILV